MKPDKAGFEIDAEMKTISVIIFIRYPAMKLAYGFKVCYLCVVASKQ